MTMKDHHLLPLSRALIVGGTNAVPGRYPYFTTLDRYCAGALIAPDIILTAGHCKPDTLADIGQLHVGTFYMDYDRDASSATDYDKETFDIVTMVRHEKFKRKGDDEFRHDFTLLKLNGQSSQTPVRLNRDDAVPAVRGQELIAIGLGDLYNEWATDDDDDNASGLSNRGPLRPDVLQQVNINYLPNEDCRLASDHNGESYSNPPNRIGPTHLCTFSPPDNTRDACAYDSGGPIIIPASDDSPDGDLLVALVSWGIGCADPIFPAVNARVAAVSDWIDMHVCQLSDAPPAEFGCQNNEPLPINPSRPTEHYYLNGWILAFVCCLVLAFGSLFVKRQCGARIAKNAAMTNYPFDQDMPSPFAWHFPGVKRRDTGETASLCSSEEDLVSYESTGRSSQV